VIGASSVDTQGNNVGSAYLYDIKQGDLLSVLANPSPTQNDYFGRQVGISEKNVIVGGFGNGGSAYIFDSKSGEVVHDLKAAAGLTGSAFGAQVEIDGNWTLVTSYGSTNPGVSSVDAVSVFDSISGKLLRTINDPSPDDREQFGHSLSISGSNLLLSSPQFDTSAPSGTVYLYDLVSGNLLRTFDNPNPNTGDRFGAAVALKGDKVLIGAPGFGAVGGVAYLFDASTGDLLHTLENAFSNTVGFGFSVALEGNTAMVGGGGSVHQFEVSTGTLVRTFENPDAGGFGISLALEGKNLIVGSSFTDQGGAAFLYELNKLVEVDPVPNPTPVPLVGSSALLLSGLASFAFATRRQKRC
jgi:hypothetical protein